MLFGPSLRPTPKVAIPEGSIIEATLIDPATLNLPKKIKRQDPEEARRIEQARIKRQEEEQERKRQQREDERKAQEARDKEKQLALIKEREEQDAEKERLRIAEEKKKKERLAKEAEKKKEQAAEEERLRLAQDKAKKAEEEKARKLAEEKKRKEAEEKARVAAEAKRKKEAADKKRREALERQMQEEQEEREEEMRLAMGVEQRRTDAVKLGLLAQYQREIIAKVTRNWNPPPSAKEGLVCKVQAEQLPGGDVISAKVLECNGDDAVKQSIEAAVKQSSPLPDPPDPTLFERKIIFTFEPE